MVSASLENVVKPPHSPTVRNRPQDMVSVALPTGNCRLVLVCREDSIPDGLGERGNGALVRLAG
jgi:hypothetical protein